MNGICSVYFRVNYRARNTKIEDGSHLPEDNVWVLAICSLMMLSVVAAIEKPSYKEDFGFNQFHFPSTSPC
ncbi:hypothetical protein T4C_6575 [Trichinella pseudospiralis]|uniref:Uncharacterized protein n=1 Tax=Trichinella pseudospiralis TaxID=6337 RepID=A0A0V1JBL5_TRIPS|nr:hypothetical protein T4C_6575 [Trichinella pseudospiralis]